MIGKRETIISFFFPKRGEEILVHMFTSSGISENIEGTLEKPETDGLSFFLSLKGIPKNKITIGDALKILFGLQGVPKQI